MLEKQDIQTIAEIFNSSIEPIKEEILELKGEVRDVKGEVQDVRGGLQDVKGEIQDVRDELQDVKGEIQDVRDGLQDVKGEVQDVRGEVQDIRDEVREIRLTLENETNGNINLIAEGHLDLSRKLDEALKVENEKEMLLIRVNHLESEVRRIKNRMEAMS